MIKLIATRHSFAIVINEYCSDLGISIAEIDRNRVAVVAVAPLAKQSHLFGKGFLRPWSTVISDEWPIPWAIVCCRFD